MTAAGVFPDGTDDYATSTTFGVDCGCDGSATTSETPAPLTPATSPTPSAGDACAAGSGVSVTSSEFPNLEGCMAEIEVFDENDEIEYLTESGLGVILSFLPTGYTEVQYLICSVRCMDARIRLRGYVLKHGPK